MMQPVFFYLFSFLAMLAGFRVVTAQNPIASALALIACFFCLAADYVLLDAHFVAVIQILVYAGAIMVLFIFVIMLLNLRESVAHSYALTRRGITGILVAGLLGIGLLNALGSWKVAGAPAIDENYGTIASMGRILFSETYLLPFEVVSVLLTVAVVGAVILAKKEV